MAKKEALTPASLVTTIFGDDPKAIVSAIQGRRAKQLGKIKTEEKYEKRTIGRNAKGKAIVSDTVYKKEYLDKHPEFAKVKKTKPAAKKVAKKAVIKKDKKEA